MKEVTVFVLFIFQYCANAFFETQQDLVNDQLYTIIL